MFNLFNKKKVFAGKQNNDEKKPAAAAAGAKTDANNAKPAPFAALGKTWAKLNKMDRKQAYTWGAVAVVALVALITLGSVVGGSSDEDFAAFETRGYDLANMPFSSDEAEQYLLASKYPDMQNTNASGLYSKAEKEARQAEDAEEAAAQLDTSVTSEASEYVPGRYYGGGSSGSVTPTQVGTLNSASLKGASGSGVSGTFGPSGDFSNFRSQDKGQDVFNAQQGRGSGNARQALFQTAVGSRAAAGQKDNRLVNAKKAMMGGNIKGSDAFLSDSGAVDLSKAAGLNLDTNAPISSVDPGLFDDALKDAQQEAEDTAQEEEEQEWWQTMLQDIAKQLAQGLVSMGMNAAQGAMDRAQVGRDAEATAYQHDISNWNENFSNTTNNADFNTAMEAFASGADTYSPPAQTMADGSVVQPVYSRDSSGDLLLNTTTTRTTVGENGQPITTTSTTTRNLSEEAGLAFTKGNRTITSTDIERTYLAGRHAPQQMTGKVQFETTNGMTLVKNGKGEYIGRMEGQKFVSGTYTDSTFTAGETNLGKLSSWDKYQMNRSAKNMMYDRFGSTYELARKQAMSKVPPSRNNFNGNQNSGSNQIYTDTNGKYVLINGQKQYLKE